MDLTEVPEGPFRRHPWEVARARFFHRVFREAGLLGAPRTVLDVGAGDGYFAGTLVPLLPTGSQVVCFDIEYSAADLARYSAPSPTGLSFVARQPTTRFDVLMLLDVIEHVSDDHGFLADLLQRNLAPGGQVVVSVPAWQPLFGPHDEGLKHHRRYSPTACRALLAASGLTVRRSGGLFHSLLLARLASVTSARLFRRPPKVSGHLGDWRAGAALSSALENALAADNALTHALTQRGWSLPGLSFWAVCEKADDRPAAP